MDLSILILSYNTRETTLQTLLSLSRALKGESGKSKALTYQVVVVDNASSDGSGDKLKQCQIFADLPNVTYTFIQSDTNTGFSRGNNLALAHATGKYILYLNSDMVVDDLRLGDLLRYLDSHKTVGALTVRVNLTSGHIDPASHRGFPTPWRSLMYYLGAEKIVTRNQKSKILPVRQAGKNQNDNAKTQNLGLKTKNFKLKTILGGYHLLGEDLDTTHEIDACTGAFLLTRKSILDELGGFDEQFFMYGEDLDLCFQIKQKGYQVIWHPTQLVTHLKYQSGLGSSTLETRRHIRWHFYDAMEKFYVKHYLSQYPRPISWLVKGTLWLVKKNFS